MTTKESIHEKIEQLDEDRARMILDYVDDLLAHSRRRESVDTTSDGQSIADHDPLLDLIGMVRSAESTNIAEHKDEYIADAILHHEDANS